MGIFQPYRAIGYITDGTPFCVQRRGVETFVTVSVGKAWQIYNCAKLTLVFVGPQLNKRIRALASWHDYTFAATGRTIVVFQRSHQISTWKAHNSKVKLLLVFGQHLLSVDTTGHLCIWQMGDADSREAVKPLAQMQLRNSFTPTCIVHPDTYLDKVLICSDEGPLQLWNIKSQQLVHEFKGWDTSIHTCVSSPALDVIAVGCSDGKIRVHNILYDETIVIFTHTNRGPVTALSFRTDGQPLLAAGDASGIISIWNLKDRKLKTVIEDAHDMEITSLHFFPNEPVLLSNAKDNSLKMWIFDSSDGEGRLLRFRSGHSAPPTCIRYYGNGRHILSAGQDRAFRVFSTIQDQQSRELSQGHVSKRAKKLKLKDEDVKLAPVVAFDGAEIRERDWCNIVTCHVDDYAAYTWRLQNFVIGEHILRPCPDDPSPVKACAISTCGNFVVLGNEAGWIERFNIQSGINRGTYTDFTIKPLGHTGSVVGLAVDATNMTLISSGYDGLVKVWDFKKRELRASFSAGSSIYKMSYSRSNGLVAAASDEFVICLYDVVAQRLVRKFQGHTDRITDLCFSDDGKWLLTSSMDATVRIWDIISAKPLDAMRLDTAVTALSLSPNMDMLATSHVNHNGVYLWANQLMYSDVVDYGCVGSGKTIMDVSMPTLSTNSADTHLEPESIQLSTAVAEDNRCVMNGPEISKDQITPELVTLALLPKAQLQGLIHLDTIKVRNKPIAPPKKPEKVPFFLPTLPSLSGVPTFATPDRKDEDVKQGKKTSFLGGKLDQGGLRSPFMQLLHKCSDEGDYSEFIDYVKSMSPSSLDAELRIIQIVDDNLAVDMQVQEIGMTLDFLVKEMASNRNFELLQALAQLILKIHGESISNQPYLRTKAERLYDQQVRSWQRLDTAFQNIRCMVGFLSNSLC